MLEQHVAAGADVTVATIAMDPAEAAGKPTLMTCTPMAASSSAISSFWLGV